MSRSRKDGRRGGAHRNKQDRELWSRRCVVHGGMSLGRYSKRLTHRAERRQAKEIAVAQLADLKSA